MQSPCSFFWQRTKDQFLFDRKNGTEKLLGRLQILGLYISLVFFGICGTRSAVQRISHVLRAQTFAVQRTRHAMKPNEISIRAFPDAPNPQASGLQISRA